MGRTSSTTKKNLEVGGDVQPSTSRLEAVYGNSFIINPSLGLYQEIHPCREMRWHLETLALGQDLGPSSNSGMYGYIFSVHIINYLGNISKNSSRACVICHLPHPGQNWDQILVGGFKVSRSNHQDLNIARGPANDHRWWSLVGTRANIFLIFCFTSCQHQL